MKTPFLLTLLFSLSVFASAQRLCTINWADRNRDLCDICSTVTDPGYQPAIQNGVFSGTLVIGRDVDFTIQPACLSSFTFAGELNVDFIFKSHLTFASEPQVASGTLVAARYDRSNHVSITYFDGTVYEPFGTNTFTDWENRVMNAGSRTGSPSPIVGPGDASTSLPVSLLEWSATQVGSNTLLTWSTAQEYDNDYFAVEHSTNGRSFVEIATLNGQRNATARTSYTSTHAAYAGPNYYRLVQYDLDGTRHEFPVLQVDHAGERTAYTTAFPNPATAGDELRFTVPNEPAIAGLYTLSGQTITRVATVPGSEGRIAVPQDLTAGFYLLRVGQQSLRIVIR